MRRRRRCGRRRSRETFNLIYSYFCCCSWNHFIVEKLNSKTSSHANYELDFLFSFVCCEKALPSKGHNAK